MSARVRPIVSGRSSGFTLLEILIAVVVLAFGLLGIVAVFPAVIDLQRRAQDAVVGGASAASAEAVFSASLINSETLDWTDVFEDEDVPRANRFPVRSILAEDFLLSESGDGADFGDFTIDIDFLWETGWGWGRFNADQERLASMLLDDGAVVLGGGASRFLGVPGLPAPDPDLQGELPTLEIPVGERLLPDAGSDSPPRYVWDAVIRRVDTGIGVPNPGAQTVRRTIRTVPLGRVRDLPVEIAIFVRPIDRGIRVPAGLTLRDVLRGFRVDGDGIQIGLDDNQISFPVSATSGDLATRRLGQRISDDEVAYSAPFSLEVRAPTGVAGDQQGLAVSVLDPRTLSADRTMDAAEAGYEIDLAAARDALRQVGQLFVDNLGVVHRVTAVFDDGRIEVTPPISAPGRRVTQIVLTPQVPADIRVIRASR
ncbi:MAG: prepilin-type N-terminal cleavage/methylation domain-containing protein [Planctomycetota bacterium]